MIVVMVRYRAYFGKVKDIKEIVGKFLEKFRDLGGVLMYDVYQDEGDDHSFVHLMKFEDSEAEKAHRNSADVKAFTDELYPFCQTEPKFSRLKVV